MSEDIGSNLPPFPSSYRASGLLLHVTSLPSPYGIGDVGPVAIASPSPIVFLADSNNTSIGLISQ